MRVQMFMNRDSAAGQGGPQLTALELPDPVGEAHRVITRYDSLVLQREDQVEIFAAQWHEGRGVLTGGDSEALIELRDVLLAQTAVGFFQRSDAVQSQLLGQPSLPGAKAPLAASARLR